LTPKYFVIKDSVQLEYSSIGLYSESVIKWNTCNEYILIIKKIYYTGGGLQLGDTLSVKVKSFNKDTLICAASAYNQSYSFQLLRSSY
jgi:hypothetical protein